MIVRLDFKRKERCGIPEIIYGKSKVKEDLLEIVKKFLKKSGRAIATKVNERKANYIINKIIDKNLNINYNNKGQVLVVKKKNFKVKKVGKIGILTAGTSDIPIAEESKAIAEELGCDVKIAYDIGVAGIHRVFPALRKMKNSNVLIVIAGMEGALPAVVSGMVDIPVIGVPTSVGYGVGKEGKAALYTMLNSCVPIAVVNIDNGYGAAVLAHQIIRNKSKR